MSILRASKYAWYPTCTDPMLKWFWNCLKLAAEMTEHQRKACYCHLTDTIGILDKFTVSVSRYTLFKRQLLVCCWNLFATDSVTEGQKSYLETQDNRLCQNVCSILDLSDILCLIAYNAIYFYFYLFIFLWIEVNC